MANFSIPEIQMLLRQAGWPENMIAKWSAIVIYESNGNPNALNNKGEYSVGLLQMNMDAHGTRFGTESQLRQPLWNLTQAYKLWKIQGDNAWKNSVKKYNNNFQGTATKAKAIYNGQPAPTNTNPLPNNTIPTGINTLTTNDKIVLGAAGLLVLLFLL